VFAIFSGLLSMVLPLGIQAIINFVQAGQVSTSWFVLVILVVTAIAFSGLVTIAQMRITENLQQRIFVKSAFEFTNRIQGFKMSVLLEKYAPELSNRFFDTLTIQKGMSKLLIDLTAAILQIVFGLILLSFYHSFFIFFGLSLVLLLLGLLKITAKKGFDSSLKESNYKYKLAHWLQELARTHFTFKSAGNTELGLNKTDSLLEKYLSARNQHFKVLVQQYGFLIAFKVLIALSLLTIGGLLVINQSMNIGQFVAAEIIILLVLSSVEKLIMSLEVVYDVLTAVEKIGQVTDLEVESFDGIVLDDENKGLRVNFKEVSFTSDIYKQPILNSVSFNVHSGEKVALISDSSVTTNVVLSLIEGIFTAEKGSITINEIPISNLNIQDLRGKTGNFMMQDKMIYGTVLENISLGRTDVTFSEIQKSCEILGLSTMIANFSDGYETMLNPDMNFIPKSVAKTILLTRCFLDKPSMFLLENPTSSLTNDQVENFVNVISSDINKTAVFSSDDKRMLAIADKIIVFKEGKILFEGTYELYNEKFATC
jgi:ABC-type bacteriocin/lantibiotic exporter with double-glycine peptidase domain